MSNQEQLAAPSRSQKLIQIIEDTIQILIEDFDLSQEDQYVEPNEINAEEIIYDVIKVLEECVDPEVCLEMIVPVIGALQKYMINLSENVNIFLIQLFLHLIQTCLSGVKGEYTLPKTIVKHIMEVVVDKLPQDEGLLVERSFLLGALVQNCNPEDHQLMDFMCQKFLIPILNQNISDDIIEAVTGCLTDLSGTFKGEFRSQRELVQTLIGRLGQKCSDKQQEALANALGDIALSGGMQEEEVNHLLYTIQPFLGSKDLSKTFRMSLIQMHTCIFNSLGEQDVEFSKNILPYVFQVIQFVISGTENDEDVSKQSLKESLSLLLDIGVLYGKSDSFIDLKKRIWNERSQLLFKQLKELLETDEDYKTLLYFDNVLQRIFQVDFQKL